MMYFPFHNNVKVPCNRAMTTHDCPKNHRWYPAEKAAQYAVIAIHNNDLFYTDPFRVEKVMTLVAKPNPYATGYGAKIPTSYGITYKTSDAKARPHRIYCMLYANSGSLYILVNNEIVFLDSDTEHRLEKMREEGAYEA